MTSPWFTGKDSGLSEKWKPQKFSSHGSFAVYGNICNARFLDVSVYPLVCIMVDKTHKENDLAMPD